MVAVLKAPPPVDTLYPKFPKPRGTTVPKSVTTVTRNNINMKETHSLAVSPNGQDLEESKIPVELRKRFT